MNNMKFDFSGMTAFIFGGAGGIGSAIAEAIGSRGGKICLFDIVDQSLKNVKENLDGQGFWVRTYLTDITNHRSVMESVESALEEAGNVDILVNSASVISRKPFFDLSPEEWQKTMSINLNGTFNACSVVGRIMLEKGYGRIVNFSSQNSSGALNNADYSASKAGIDSLTRSLAVEFREKSVNVTVNAISPPPTITNLWKEGRSKEQIESALEKGTVFESHELMDIIMFLCSGESEPISGQIINHKANLFRVPNK